MSADHTDNSPKRRRAEEAANILRRLDLDPNDRLALRDRDAFIARGKDEKETLNRMSQAFNAAPSGLRRRDRRYSVVLVAALIGSLYFSYDPVRIAVLADYRTPRETAVVALASGDVTVLDASTAIQDNTQNRIRQVDLLKGSAFFDVQTNGSRFVVQAGDVQAEALGTEFEVSYIGDDIIVTVAEGLVGVTYKGQVVNLSAGEQLVVSDSGSVRRHVDGPAIANWRSDKLNMDGMSFAEAAAIIGRRLSGTTLVVNRALAHEPVIGVLDLTTPDTALETLAATGGASVLRLPGTFNIIY